MVQYEKVIPLDAFQKVAQSNNFLNNTFSSREINEYYHPTNLRSLAARWLIKEMLGEATKRNLDNLGIEIINNEFGKPELFFSPENLKVIQTYKIKAYDCSISHSKSLVTAFLVIEKEDS